MHVIHICQHIPIAFVGVNQMNKETTTTAATINQWTRKENNYDETKPVHKVQHHITT